jgi:hypothetical protein
LQPAYPGRSDLPACLPELSNLQEGSYSEAGPLSDKDLMNRNFLIALAVIFLSAATSPLAAQDWRPPSSEMPSMPGMSELGGNWMGPRANWFAGVGSVAGVDAGALSAVGQARSGSPQAQVVHFNSGPLPVVSWQDRNSDGRADVVEIFRAGGVIIQVIDADYNGQANVMRVYDAGGALLREDRF